MELEFWHDKWERNEIGFHLDSAHPWLVHGAENLGFQKQETVFVPLCGKTHDIDFFLQQGLKVVANELSEIAVKELFQRLGIKPVVQPFKGGLLYESECLKIFVGDFFQIKPDQIFQAFQAQVDWVYDRAALVALPFEMRQQYSRLLMQLCPNAKHILMTLDYDQQKMSGPPFSLSHDEVLDHYAEHYLIDIVHEQDIIEKEPRFKQRGLTAFHQRLYLLTPR